jgi:hypothetical protein
MKQESQTEQTLNSINVIKRAILPAALQERIMNTATLRSPRIVSLSKPAILLLAASLAMLIGFNVYTLARQSQPRKTSVISAQQDNPVADEYFGAAPSI